MKWMVPAYLATAFAVKAGEPDAIAGWFARQAHLCDRFANRPIETPFWVHRHSFGGCQAQAATPAGKGDVWMLDIACEDGGETVSRMTWLMQEVPQTGYEIVDQNGAFVAALACKGDGE